MSRSRRVNESVASSSRHTYNDLPSFKKNKNSGHIKAKPTTGRSTANSQANSPYSVRTAVEEEQYEFEEDEQEDEYRPPRQSAAPVSKRKRGRPPKSRSSEHHSGTHQPLRIRLKTSASNSPNVLPVRSHKRKLATESESSSENGSLSSEDEKTLTHVSRPTISNRVAAPPIHSHPGSEEESDQDVMSGGIESTGVDVWELSAPAAFVTWSEDEDALAGNSGLASGIGEGEDTEDVEGLEEEDDFQELLAWGNGEMKLEGMPETEQDSQAATSQWFAGAPSVYGLELNTTTDEEDHDVADSEDDAMDSSEEVDQMMVINGLYGDSDDSEDGGNTTDTLDDADEDGLARFGIETDEVHIPHESCQEVEILPAHNTRGSSKKQSKKADKSGADKPIALVPPMGDFIVPVPSPFGRKAMTILDGTQQGPILSPFSVTRVRRTKRNRSGSESVTPSRRKRRGSFTSSRSTLSAPSLNLDRPSPPSDILEEDEALMMELDLGDILEASILGGADVEVVLHESEGETDADGAQGLDFSRWDRIPIGAFRRSRTTYEVNPSQAAALQNGPFNNGNAAVYLPIATAILSAAQQYPSWQPTQSNKRAKITRQEAIGMSPMLMPILTSRVPSSIKSRKDRRADRKRANGRSSASLAGTTNGDLGSPAPDLAISALSLEQSASPAPFSAIPDLPAATLPSSGMNISNSPLFSAAARAHGIPAFSLVDEFPPSSHIFTN